MRDNIQHERLRKVRKELGLSQSEFASSIGVEQAYLSHLENGKVGIGSKILFSLIEKYNISSDWIFTGEGSMFKQNNSRIVAKAIMDIEKVIENLKRQGIDVKTSLAKGTV